jgi:hypothetical protein
MSENTTPAAMTAAPAGPLFELGFIVTTPSIRALALERTTIDALIQLHTAGQWDMGADDIQRNMDAIQAGDRVFGAFETPAGRIWIITEPDRSSTCVMSPEDY